MIIHRFPSLSTGKRLLALSDITLQVLHKTSHKNICGKERDSNGYHEYNLISPTYNSNLTISEV